jgi:hypothetical protein
MTPREILKTCVRTIRDDVLPLIGVTTHPAHRDKLLGVARQLDGLVGDLGEELDTEHRLANVIRELVDENIQFSFGRYQKELHYKVERRSGIANSLEDVCDQLEIAAIEQRPDSEFAKRREPVQLPEFDPTLLDRQKSRTDAYNALQALGIIPDEKTP